MHLQLLSKHPIQEPTQTDAQRAPEAQIRPGGEVTPTSPPTEHAPQHTPAAFSYGTALLCTIKMLFFNVEGLHDSARVQSNAHLQSKHRDLEACLQYYGANIAFLSETHVKARTSKKQSSTSDTLRKFRDYNVVPPPSGKPRQLLGQTQPPSGGIAFLVKDIPLSQVSSLAWHCCWQVHTSRRALCMAAHPRDRLGIYGAIRGF